MKKIFLSFLVFAALAAQAQTADEIVQKYTAAMGGLESFQKVQTAKFSGTVTAQGNDFPITVIIVAGKAMRTDVDVMGQSVVNVYKDGKGWKINPFAGAETATDVEGVELSDFKAQATLVSAFMDYKAQGHKIELVGQEMVEGVNTNKVKFTNKDDGRVTMLFFSVKDNMLVKAITARQLNGETKDIETYFSNAKEFGGLKFYMTRDQKLDGELFQSVNFSNVELNVSVDDKIFNK